MNILLPIVLVALAGAAVALQPAFNAQLAGYLGSSLRAALANFAAGAALLACLAGALALRAAEPDGARPLSEVPLHLWLVGGALGAVFVVTATWAAPKIGSGAFFAVLIAAQLIAALILDHFGLIGMEEKPATLARLAGLGLLVIGAWLMVRG